VIRREILTTFLSVLLMLIAIGYVSAANYYVSVGGAGANDGSSWGNAFAEIQAAVGACVSGADTIHIANGTYKAVSNGGEQSYPINIDSKTGITMLGYGQSSHGPWLQGDGQSRITVIKHCSDITIKNFKVSDGSATGNGGGIRVVGTDGDENVDIVMFDLEITNNTSYAKGGGMAWEYSCGVISNCCIWDNRAPGNAAGAGGGGGGIFLMWPAASNTYEGYYVRDCCIFWNEAQAQGGGILVSGDHNSSEVQNNLIRQNCVGTEGAGAGIESNCARVYAKNNTVVDNYHCDDNMPTYGKDAAGGPPTLDVYGIKGCDTEGYWLRMIHNIVYFNGPPGFDDVNIHSNIEVMYSDVQMTGTNSPYPGTGNIDQRPEFEGDQDEERPCNSTFYFLSENSPCLDAGIPAYTDEWGQGHCEFVNTTTGQGKDTRYSVHLSTVEDKDFWCNDGNNHDDHYRIDLGYHYDWYGMNYIELSSFTVEAGFNKALVRWETATEIDNAGFLVYRCDGEATGCSKVSEFIPATAFAAAGADYSFMDTNVRQGATYYYYLVDIDTSGNWTAHGPLMAQTPVRLAKPLEPEMMHELVVMK